MANLDLSYILFTFPLSSSIKFPVIGFTVVITSLSSNREIILSNTHLGVKGLTASCTRILLSFCGTFMNPLYIDSFLVLPPFATSFILGKLSFSSKAVSINRGFDTRIILSTPLTLETFSSVYSMTIFSSIL
ncbi:131aa long hypothetical protein [Pyrococcus horikoshii OT3]|uniref:Uncharacterized protein n=1 Tax=Pyrococcus horikoshii (strain ATCC 700860 / DSM 12428 / JCM 9974 / NBRC 100139 / OT-3) TaxID=70601 RepID=O58137_PYRHO|nr:131aa long hypothetical protein [Pyrococcus horikoshii OT3]